MKHISPYHIQLHYGKIHVQVRDRELIGERTIYRGIYGAKYLNNKALQTRFNSLCIFILLHCLPVISRKQVRYPGRGGGGLSLETLTHV